MEYTKPAPSASVGPRAALALARLRADVLLAVVDSVLAAAAFVGALAVRFSGEVPEPYQQRMTVLLPLLVLLVVAIGWMWGLYAQIWTHASILEARRVLLAGTTSLGVLLLCESLDPNRIPLSVIVMGAVGTTFLQGLVRFQARLFAFRRRGGSEHGVRVVVIGAGRLGASLVRDMLEHPHVGLVPVALLDDDPRNHGRSCGGVRVLGGIDALEAVARRTEARQAVVAVEGASAELVRSLSLRAERSGLSLRTLSGVSDQMHHGATVQDLRELRIDDLLGRQAIQAQVPEVRELLAGRRVLITGAGGSIGSEIASQVATYGPAELLLVDNDETHLHDIASRLPRDSVQILLDVRDRQSLLRCFAKHRPEVVFHAAAHKHVPLLEDHPSEAVKTNVCGTQNLVDAAMRSGVSRFMFISTDKAVRPRAVMGATKAVGEQLVLACAANGHRYSAVRFGNVLGSRGSVVPTFLDQIGHGGPVTVTDPRMTRFFMTIPEAVQLVLTSAAMAKGGEVFMLDMGDPVRILDLAQRMIRLSGRRVGEDVEIRVTGPRPGEKLEEELHTPDEQVTSTAHPSIVRLEPVRVPGSVLAREVTRLAAAAEAGLDVAVRDGLFALVQRRPWLVSDDYVPRQHDGVLDLTGREAAWTPSTT